MTVNYTTNLSLGLPVTGTESGTWGDDVNNATTAYLDISIAGGLAVTVTVADVTLTNTQGTSSATNIGSTTAQYAILNISGAMTAARNLILPSSSRQYVINNNTTGGFALTVKGSATSGVTMVNGEKAHIFWNGSDYAKLSNAPGGAGTFSSLTNSGLTSGRVVYSTTGGLEASSAGLTFDGTNFATTGTATATKLIPTGTSVTGNGMYLPAANALGLSTNGTNAVYIDASQNVGIATNSPNTRLQVYKAAASAFTGTSPGALLVTDSTNTLNYFTSIDFNTTNAPSVPYARIGMSYTSGGSTLSFGTTNNYASGITNTAMTIDPTGNLLVGLNSASLGGLLEVNGIVAGYSLLRFPYVGSSTGTAVIIDSSGYIRALTSSRRYKENIEPIDVGLDLVMQMQPVKYNLKEGGAAQIGFIAEDFPEARLVNYSMVDPTNTEKGEQIESVNYNNLTAILVKAIQEQQALITQLTDRIAALEAR